jgi:hypothetical protein
MAFIKLFPREDRDPLSIEKIVELLRTEFEIVDVDPEEGQSFVDGMIAAALRISDVVPGKQERLALFQSAQPTAVFVSFGDDLSVMADFCLWTGSELFFDSPDVLHGPARPLLDRAALALGYEQYPG